MNMAARNRRFLLTGSKDNAPTWAIDEQDVPTAPHEGLVVRVLHAGVCHSDVHMSQPGSTSKIKVPRVFGHEIAGVVHELGKDISSDKVGCGVGDRVIVYPWGNCNKCAVCQHDLPFCDSMTNPLTDRDSLYVYGVWRDGGFQSYVVVDDASFIITVPEAVPLDVAAMVPCSGITSFNACGTLTESIDRAIRIHGRAAVGLMGAGGLALWALQILRTMYPTQLLLVAIDINDDKLEDAKKQGADKTFKWGATEAAGQVAKAFVGEIGGLLDGVIDFTGIPEVQSRGFSILNVGGTMTLVGLGRNPTPGFSLMATLLRNITIRGIVAGSRKMCREMFTLISEGKVKSPPIKEIRLEDIEDSLVQMRNNTIRGRHVVKM